MVAQILRLRLDVLLGALRAPGALVPRLAGSLVVLAAVVLACVGVLGLAGDSADVAAALLTLTGTALVLGFALAPVMSGAEDPLDPRRFAAIGLEPRQLLGPLALASLVSVPTVALIAIDVCAAVTWVRIGVSPWLATAATVLHIVTCLGLARLSSAFGTHVLRGRRTRELTSLFVLGIVVVVLPVVVFFSSLEWGGHVPSRLQSVVESLAASPLGAAAGMPGAVTFAWPVAGWSIAMAVLALVAVALAWAWTVRRAMTTIDPPADDRDRAGLGWFAVAPATPTGAIAARSIMYWFGDARYLMNLAIIPVVGLLPVLPLLVAGVPGTIAALVPVPIMALFLGWVAHNDIAYDSSAVWMHVTAGVSGLADRIGRLVPVLLVAIPTLAVAIPVAASFHGRWALVPAFVGVAAALFLGGLGLSSIASVVAPYPVSRPGDSPFRQPQRTGSGGVVAQTAVMFGSLLLAAPTLWLAWRALTEDVAFASAAQWAGLGTGLGVLLVGVVVGAALWDRRAYRVMEFAAAT